MAKNRSAHALAALGDYLYASGGWDEQGEIRRSVERCCLQNSSGIRISEYFLFGDICDLCHPTATQKSSPGRNLATSEQANRPDVI